MEEADLAVGSSALAPISSENKPKPMLAQYKKDRQKLELTLQKQLQKPTQAARLAFAYRNLNNHFANIPIKLKYVYDVLDATAKPVVSIDAEAVSAETADAQSLAPVPGKEETSITPFENFTDGLT